MRRVPLAEFESDPVAIIEEVEKHGRAIALVRDGIDVLFLRAPEQPLEGSQQNGGNRDVSS